MQALVHRRHLHLRRLHHLLAAARPSTPVVMLFLVLVLVF
jgi:hypothetical protein